MRPANHILLANMASTLALVGVIWIVQIVHYPLFGRVGADGFARYATEHAGRITYVVAPLMLVELATALLLLGYRPETVGPRAVWAGLALVGVVWASTFLLQVPLHGTLGRGFDQVAYERLVLTNWVRTVAWTLRGVVGVICVVQSVAEGRTWPGLLGGAVIALTYLVQRVVAPWSRR